MNSWQSVIRLLPLSELVLFLEVYMCHVIKSRYILANYLLHHATGCMTIPKLRELQAVIEQKYPDVFVDISLQSLTSAVEDYPQMFSWEDAGISRAEDSAEYFDEERIRWQFNTRLPRGVDLHFLDQVV